MSASRSVASMTATLFEDYGVETDIDFLDHMRATLFERFRTELRPIDGIAETLDRLVALKRCVASSSQPERIRYSLGLTGLIDKFEPHVFSATMVKNGKPAPDLFLHAAREMGADPRHCIVIEDSPAGIAAAKAAGMAVLPLPAARMRGFPHSGKRSRVSGPMPRLTPCRIWSNLSTVMWGRAVLTAGWHVTQAEANLACRRPDVVAQGMELKS